MIKQHIIPMLLLCILLRTSIVVASNLNYGFSNLSTKDGLSNQNITSICQDKLGYIWIASMRGLNKYNGTTIQNYFYNPTNSINLRSNLINSVICSKNGNIYIGTDEGLDIYNPVTDSIEQLFGFLNTNILNICEHENFIYLSTGTGIYRFNEDKKELIKIGKNWKTGLLSKYLLSNGKTLIAAVDYCGIAIYNDKTDTFEYFTLPTDYMDIYVSSVCKLDDNLIAVCTKTGIYYFELKNKKYIYPEKFKVCTNTLRDIETRFIVKKNEDEFIIGTYRSGLFVFNSKLNLLQRKTKNDINSTVNSNSHMNYFVDKDKNIWLATFDAGIDIIFKNSPKYNFIPQLNNLLRSKFITSIDVSRQNILYVSTREEGFYTFDLKTREIKQFNVSNSRLANPYIRTLYIDNKNRCWIGMHFGLQVLMPDQRTIKNIYIPKPNNGIVSILESEGKFFIGTDQQGLLILDDNGNTVKQVLQYGNNITKIIELNNDELICSSFGYGLFTINKKDLNTKAYWTSNSRHKKAFMKTITMFSNKDKLWIGTYSYGAFCIIDSLKQIKRYINEANGLKSGDVVGIIEDDDSNIWLSTSLGLYYVNSRTYVVKPVYNNDNLNYFQYHEKAVSRSKDGILFFGGTNGITYFYPKEALIKKNTSPVVYLERLFINNEEVKPGSNSKHLKQSLQFTKELVLNHKDRLFSIEFNTIDYQYSESTEFYYTLEGFDKRWYSIGNQRRVSFSNLPRGTYTFRVKAKNINGAESENEAQLKLIVVPSFWTSYFAIAIYALILLGIGAYIFKLIIKTIVYKKELTIEQYEHTREKEIHLMKQKFFTNISHEFRTPLTIISGITKVLANQKTESNKDLIDSLEQSVSRILNLINQLLTFKKIEDDKITLWLEKKNIKLITDTIIKPYVIYANEKNIKLISYVSDVELYIDIDKYEKIITNLLSNAIKHSPAYSIIEIFSKHLSLTDARNLYQFNLDEAAVLDSETGYLEIEVKDSGNGISKEKQLTIFQRYNSTSSQGVNRPDYSSIGIGLNFTKMLVQTLRGAIRVESNVGEGSSFMFLLAKDEKIYRPEDFGLKSKTDNVVVKVENIDSMNDQTGKTILLIEDDVMLTNFMKQSLSPYFKVVSTFTAEEALDLIKRELPDIIVSDVMLPGMNGLEFTKQIKSNFEISHIPLILLTAKAELADQIEGLRYGADAYIPKPFEFEYLLAEIETLIKNRKIVHDLFLSGKMPDLQKVEISQADMHFISRLNKIIETNISNINLDINFLAKEMNMSRSTFYRKFEDLTRLSPLTYIKKIRLNYSQELIKTGKYTLTEVSELSGFSSLSYFSTAFKNEYTYSPSSLMNDKRKSQ